MFSKILKHSFFFKTERVYIFQDIVTITSEYMLKPPFKPMKISSHKLLSRSSLSHVLKRIQWSERKGAKLRLFFVWRKLFTKAGKHSVACLRRTENPPWVLVSDAVRIFTNEWNICFVGSTRGGSRLVSSLCYKINK